MMKLMNYNYIYCDNNGDDYNKIYCDNNDEVYNVENTHRSNLSPAEFQK